MKSKSLVKVAQPKRLVGSTGGRPAGSANADVPTKIKRRLKEIYEASIAAAVAGDADAARLMLDVAKHPEKYPMPESEH